MRVLSLFSGIGGLDLGLERAGMTIVAHSEIDSYASRVLAKHWPGVPNVGDITKADWSDWVGLVDVIAGGFPCQDVSRAGRRVGVVDGIKSGLFREVVRAVRDLRPRYVLLENTATLTANGLGEVLWQLAALGYDAEWECLSAAAFGANHIRDRMFVVAYPRGGRYGAQEKAVFARRAGVEPSSWWAVEPGIRRVDDGPATRLHKSRKRALGNAVVPQVAEYVGRLVVEHWEAS